MDDWLNLMVNKWGKEMKQRKRQNGTVDSGILFLLFLPHPLHKYLMLIKMLKCKWAAYSLVSPGYRRNSSLPPLSV
jgi:hypothetical protein